MRHRFYYPLLLLPLLLFACYEDNVACLDPDASNYDLRADEACGDCCTYPNFNLAIERFWGDEAFVLTNEYTDAALNAFRLIRFRYYLSDLELVAGNTFLPVPENEVEVGIVSGADTITTLINANLILANASGSNTSTVGTIRTGIRALTQVQGTVGLSNAFSAIYPPTAPAASPLSTQPGLMNYNDGNGYLQASAEYVLTATDDTIRIDLLGTQPLLLDFPEAITPIRGNSLTLVLSANFAQIFGAIDLTASNSVVADGIRQRLPNFLQVTDFR